jgi:transposase
MRKIKEILRLCWENGLSARQAAASCGIGRATIKEYLDRAEKAGLSWPLSEDLDEASLENLLFPSTISFDAVRRNMPPFDYLHKELKRKHMTLQRLWEEHKEHNPDGYQYSSACGTTLRQDYKAGEKLFVDYAGDTVPIHDATGGTTPAYLFVATLGASNYSYVEAVLSRELPSWIRSHVHTFE